MLTTSVLCALQLFDPQLSRQVRERIERLHLFGSASLALHNERSRELTRRLREFIALHVDAGTSSTSLTDELAADDARASQPPVPYPNRAVLFRVAED